MSGASCALLTGVCYKLTRALPMEASAEKVREQETAVTD